MSEASLGFRVCYNLAWATVTPVSKQEKRRVVLTTRPCYVTPADLVLCRLG